MTEMVTRPYSYPSDVPLHERYGYPLTEEFQGVLGQTALDALGITTGFETRFMKNHEGRQLAVQQAGHPAGEGVKTILAMHGTPGERTAGLYFSEETLECHGIRLITYDRPGYSYSDPPLSILDHHPVDSVKDVDAIMKELEIDVLDGVIGVSGGGVHALACATLRPYVKKAAILVTPAPIEYMGADYYDRISASNRDAFETMEANPEQLIEEFQASAEEIRRNPAALFKLLQSEFAIDDRVMFGRPRAMQNIEADLLRSYQKAVAFGGEGRAADIIGEARWGFDPRDHSANPGLRVLNLYTGDDVFVPSTSGMWFANNIPGVESVCIEGASHFRAKDPDVTFSVLDWIIDDRPVKANLGGMDW